MKTTFMVIGVTGLVIVVIVLAIGAFYGVSFVGLHYKKVFDPKFENVRREVFENTRSYNQAKLQDLAKYRLEYVRSTDEAEKSVIASVIRHRFADFDANKLPLELRNFLSDIRGY